MNWILTLKAKIITIGVLLLTVLAYVANHKRVVNKLEKTKKKLDSAKAEIRIKKQVNELDNEVLDEVGSRRIAAFKEIRDGKRPKNISDPDDF